MLASGVIARIDVAASGLGRALVVLDLAGRRVELGPSEAVRLRGAAARAGRQLVGGA